MGIEEIRDLNSTSIVFAVLAMQTLKLHLEISQEGVKPGFDEFFGAQEVCVSCLFLFTVVTMGNVKNAKREGEGAKRFQVGVNAAPPPNEALPLAF